jgi:hypothetical protein
MRWSGIAAVDSPGPGRPKLVGVLVHVGWPSTAGICGVGLRGRVRAAAAIRGLALFVFPLLRGRIVSSGEGSEIHITMRPWLPDLLGPVAMSGFASYVSWRSGAFAPLLVAAVVVGPVVLIGWLVGARRARMILRAALDAV